MHCWPLNSGKDILAVERMLTRFAKMLPRVECFNHKERLKRLGLFFLRESGKAVSK